MAFISLVFIAVMGVFGIFAVMFIIGIVKHIKVLVAIPVAFLAILVLAIAVLKVIAAVEDEASKPSPAVVPVNEAVLQAAEAAKSSRAAARASGTGYGQQASSGLEEQVSPISATLANFTPRSAVSQYQTAGTREAVAQAMARETQAQTFSEVLASVNHAQSLSDAEEAGQEDVPVTAAEAGEQAEESGVNAPVEGAAAPVLQEKAAGRSDEKIGRAHV